jgi:hypothetical protein
MVLKPRPGPARILEMSRIPVTGWRAPGTFAVNMADMTVEADGWTYEHPRVGSGADDVAGGLDRDAYYELLREGLDWTCPNGILKRVNGVYVFSLTVRRRDKRFAFVRLDFTLNRPWSLPTKWAIDYEALALSIDGQRFGGPRWYIDGNGWDPLNEHDKLRVALTLAASDTWRFGPHGAYLELDCPWTYNLPLPGAPTTKQIRFYYGCA